MATATTLALSGVASAVALPDGRGYEMVTPANKPGEMFPTGNGLTIHADTDGDHVFMDTENALTADTPDNAVVFRSDRTPTGWNTVSALPASRNPGGDVALLGFSDLNDSVLIQTPRNYDPADNDAETNTGDFYNVMPDWSFTWMSPNEVDPAPTTYEIHALLAATDDAQGIVFQHQGEPLLPEDSGRLSYQYGLYEFRDGQLRVVALDNSDSLLTTGPVTLGGLDAGYQAISFNAYSRDGSHIFFTTQSGGAPTDQAGLWVRLNGTTTEPVPAAPAGANASVVFLGATPDGTKAYIESDQQLTPDDHDSSPDLYEYTVATHALRRLSAGANPAGVVQRPVWSSDDGSRVYFTATGQLIPGQGPVNGSKTYVYDNGTLKLVAPAELITAPMTYQNSGAASGGPECGPTRVTPDGRYFVAETPAALTPDDQDGGATDVYRYDAVTGQIVHVSTGPSDSNSSDGASINTIRRLAGVGGCDSSVRHLTHPMSDDGRFVFFETKAALVPQDSNGNYDVYEWNADTGKTSLISSGTDSDASDLADGTPDGRAVFFTTREQLVPQDTNSELDVYTARIGGGFPPPPPPPVPCAGSECQGAGGSQPSFPLPGSLSLMLPAGSGSHPGGLTSRRLSAAALRQIARLGRVRVTVVPATDGVVSVTVVLRRPDGHHLTAGRATVAGVAGKATSVTVRLNRAARRLLRAHTVVMDVRVHQDGAGDVTARYVVHRTARGGR